MRERRQQLAEIALEPLDVGRLRSCEATQAWETFRGKVNRISIGLPHWQLECGHDRAGGGLAPPLDTLATMTVDLTLLPDVGCRFANAELALSLESADGSGHAIVTRLEPAELADHAVVVREASGGAQVSVVPSVHVGLEVSGRARQEVTRTLVRLAAFGAGTSEAGWRLALTDARDIPLNTMDLTSTIAYPSGWRGTVWFSVVAQLQIRSHADRWLTAAFGMRDTARLACSQEFPPG